MHDFEQVEQVSQFKYLGRWISDDGYATKYIRARIVYAWFDAFKEPPSPPSTTVSQNRIEPETRFIAVKTDRNRPRGKNATDPGLVHGQEKIANRKIKLWAKVLNYKEHSLECSIVCSKDLYVDKNKYKAVGSI